MTTPARRLRLVAYLRVSTTGQVDAYGLEIQETDARAWAKSNNARIVKVSSDEGISGTVDVLDREGLAEAIGAVQDGTADGILIPSLSRLGRTLAIQEAALSLVWQAGGRVFTVDAGETIADDPNDPMRTAMRQMIGVLHQLDRATIVMRMRKGREAKAAAGKYAGGAPPYGYQAHEKSLVPREEEQAVIAQMTEWRAAGGSYETIAARLNAEQIPTKRKGGRWGPATVQRILDPEARTRARTYQQKAKNR